MRVARPHVDMGLGGSERRYFGVAYLDVADICRVMDVTRETVLRRIRAHRLRTFRKRRALLVLKADWVRVEMLRREPRQEDELG